MTSLARHKLAWLSKEGWEEALNGQPEAAREATAVWRERGWPVIVRRNDAYALQEQACLGIALPPAPGSGFKHRIELRVSTSRIEQLTDPLPLERVIDTTPAAWHPQLAAMHREATALGIHLLVYGSAALQCLTGVRYMTPTSDLDLLFHPATRAQLENGLALLSNYAGMLPLDGEIVFPNGWAVAWKEWLHAERTCNGTRVLVKNLCSVRLMTMTDLQATLD